MDTELFKPEYTEGAIELIPKRPAGIATLKISLQQVRNNIIIIIVKPVYSEHSLKCPDYQGVLIFQVSLHANGYLGITKCPDYAGVFSRVLIKRFHCTQGLSAL